MESPARQIHLVPPPDRRQSETALAIARGTARLLRSLGFACVSVLPLPSGRRAGVVVGAASATLLTPLAGSLWTLCLFVAPALFAILEDRHVAGRIAGQLFRIEAWLGLALAPALLGVRARDKALARRIPWLPLVLAAAAPPAAVLALGPLMAAARAADDALGR